MPVADTAGPSSRVVVAMPAAASPSGVAVRRLARVSDTEMEGLTALLIDCVEGGASVGFMHPLDATRARAFWRQVAEGVARDERVLLVAEADDGGGIVGTVQLVLDLPENQPHRGDVSKMLVRRSSRRSGIGAALMQAAEDEARARRRTLLVLDTASADAERLYERCGWRRCGTVPGFALLPGGGLCDTTFFFRRLAP
jgi:GNAT superfamily N-acetyltransferase